MTENTGGRPEGTTYGSRADREHGLTPRERDVLAGLTAGKTGVEIAAELGISRQAVSQIKRRFDEEAEVLALIEKGVPSGKLASRLGWTDDEVAPVVKRLRLRGTIEEKS